MLNVVADQQVALKGISATYTPGAGDGVSLTVVECDPEAAADTAGGDGIYRAYERAVEMDMDPSAEHGGVAAPALNDTITIGSTTYAVAKVQVLPGGWARLGLEKKTTQRYATDGHFGQK